MFMTRTFQGVALLMLLLACLLVSAPARLLGMLLPQGQIVMQGFSGSLWRGSASRCLVQAGPGYLHMGTVQWRLEPLSLLLLAPRLSLDSKWGGQTLATGLVLRGQQDIDLYDLEANIPAGLVRQFAPVALGGMLSVQLERLQLRGGLPQEASGRLVWRDGVWLAPSGPITLGSYAMDIGQDPGGPLTGEVLTLSGPVEASGAVQLQDRAYAIDISVAGQGAQDPRLQQALSLVASPQGQGYHIKLDGDFQ